LTTAGSVTVVDESPNPVSDGRSGASSVSRDRWTFIDLAFCRSGPRRHSAGLWDDWPLVA
jgi:hypothetical protein